MQGDFKNLIIEFFNRYYGYNIIEINYINGRNFFWALSKKIFNEDKLVVICDDVNFENTKESMCKYVEISNYNLNHVSVTVVINSNNGFNKNRFIKQYNDIIFDEVSGVIDYLEDDNKEIAQGINVVLSYIEEKNIIKTDSSLFTATNIFIGINIIMFIIEVIYSANLSNLYGVTGFLEAITSIKREVMVVLGAKINALINNGQLYRLFTSVFLHWGIVHLSFNMYSLYVLGNLIEKLYGSKKYVFIYFFSGISGSLLSYLISTNSISAGASGAIFGLLGSALIYGMSRRRNIGKAFMNNILQVIFINLILGITMSNIDNMAHIGGLIGGMISTYLITKLDKHEY
jgi:rhomboid protease GluP